MFEVGFSFKITENGLIGVINEITRPGLYSVSFYEGERLYLMADVWETTIEDNLKYGYYEALK